MKGQNPRNLIISRVGDHSLHHEWLQPAIYKNFDLCLSYYGDQPNRYAGECDYHFEIKGPKWPKLKETIEALGDRIFDYDAVWFPDDDISTNAYNINRMFQIFHEQQMMLAQPALTLNSYYLWPITLQRPDHIVRFLHFVEIMVPIFSVEALMECLNTFDKNLTGWGLDSVWPNVLGYPDKKIGIIDATPVKHTRPTGQGDLYKNISEFYNITGWEKNELHVLDEYLLDPRYHPEKVSPYDAILIRNGNPLELFSELVESRRSEKHPGNRTSIVKKKRKKKIVKKTAAKKTGKMKRGKRKLPRLRSSRKTAFRRKRPIKKRLRKRAA